MTPPYSTLMRRVYIAASSSDLERFDRAASRVRAAGCSVAMDWATEVRRATPQGEMLTQGERREITSRCIATVASSDVLWMLLPRAGVYTSGMWAEMGAAIHAGVPIVASGAAESDKPLSIFLSACTTIYDCDAHVRIDR